MEGARSYANLERMYYLKTLRNYNPDHCAHVADWYAEKFEDAA
jgi:hypothetical protein